MDDMVRFAVLGSLEVLDTGGQIAITGGKRRALLALLIVRNGRVTPVDRIVDELWGPDAEGGARSTVQTYVSQLRKLLPAGAIVSRGGAYGLDVEPTSIDVFDESMATWSGDPLAEFAGQAWADDVARELTQGHLVKCERRIDGLLAANGQDDALVELERLVTAHPLHERFRAQQMLAFYRSGRQADALAAARALRVALLEGLGVDPSDEIETLERRILDQDPRLRAVAALQTGTLAILFTDLVASTELRLALGDQTADDYRRLHDRIVAGATAFHGGTRIKGTGDGSMCAFAGGADAVAAGVRIQRDIERHNRSADDRIELRVGIGLGDVTVEDGDVFGVAAIESARLCQAAGAGEVYLTDIVRLVSGSRLACELEPIGALELKGLPGPVLTWAARWEPLPDDDQPRFPELLDAHAPLPFAGRRSEMERLTEIWAAARSGARSLVLLAGEPGIGKTRLATEFARMVHTQGAIVLHGWCDADADAAAPFQPFGHALDTYLRMAVTPTLGEFVGELRRLSPLVTKTSPDSPEPTVGTPEVEHHRLMEAVAAWLAALSQVRPTLFVLDDAHWATRPTVQMLAHLLRTIPRGRLLVLATHRESERSGPFADALADLGRMGQIVRVDLGGLDVDGTRTLLDDSLPHDQLDAWARVLVERTAGNPLFIGELLRQHAQTGGPRIDSAPGPLPATVKDVVRQRVARLDPTVAPLLEVAAVMGREVHFDVVADVAGCTVERVIGAIAEASRARLVEETVSGRFRFSHEIVREALEEDLIRAQREHLHRATAESLANRHPTELAGIAAHWQRAGALVDGPRATAATIAAAEDATARAAPDEALEWYERAAALAIESDAEQIAALLERVGDLRAMQGDHAGACASLLAAVDLLGGSPIDEGRILRKAACTHRAAHRYPEAIALFADGRVRLEQAADRDATWWFEWLQLGLERMELHYWTNEPFEMEVIAAELRKEVEQHGSRAQRADFAKGQLLQRLRESRYVVDDGIAALAEESMSHLLDETNRSVSAFYRFHIGFVALWGRDLDRAETWLQDALRTAQRSGDRLVQARCWTYLVVASRFAGDVGATRVRVRELAELASTDSFPEYKAAALAGETWIARRDDRPDDAVALALAALSGWAELPLTYSFQWQARLPLLAVLHDRGLCHEALDHAALVLDPSQQRLPDMITVPLRAAVDRGDPALLSNPLRTAAQLGYT